MPKFYVLSGLINEVVDAEDEMQACLKCLNKYAEDPKLQYVNDFCVSERGLWHDEFDAEADCLIPLQDVIKESGWLS
jgi:hypothetical protein